MEPKYELIQLLSDQRRELIQPLLSEHRRYRCFGVGACDLRRLFLSEHRRLRRCNDGYRGKCALGWSRSDGKREQRALAGLSVAARVSSLGSTIKGPAPCSFPSSSDAPVCASLVRAASAKSSPPMHARVIDNHPRSIALNVSQSLFADRDSGQPLCMKTNGGLLSAAEADT